MQHRWIGPLLIGVVALVLVGLGGATLYRQQFNTLLRGLEPSCTLGVGTGTVTVQAWSANDDCQSMLGGQDNFTGQNWTKLGATPVSNVTGATICEMEMSGRHVTIRDVGNTGAVLCTMLEDPVIPVGQ